MQRILILVFGLWSWSLVAQQATGVIYAAPTAARDGVQIKWLSQELTAEEGFHIYRRATGTQAWDRLTQDPLMVGKTPVPPAVLAADSSLQIASRVATEQQWSDLPGMAKVNLVTSAIVNPDFARFLGIHYDDQTAVSGQSYEYEVRRLEDGRESFLARSPSVGPDSPENYPQAPTLAGAFDEESGNVALNWSHDEKLAFAYHLERVDPGSGRRTRINTFPILILSDMGDAPEFRDGAELAAGVYRYELSSIDYLGRVSPLVATAEVEMPDREPPLAPTEPTSDNSVDGVITLGWAASVSPDLKNYRIYRAPDIESPVVLVGETSGKETRFTDNTLPGYGYYYYEIQAVDEAGNESTIPLYHIANGSDLYPPSPPANVKITAESGRISLRWDKNPEGDIRGYLIMRSVDVKGTNDWAALHVEPFPDNRFDDNLPPTRRNTMIYHVIAMDTSGNRSEPSAVVRIAMPDEVSPPVPFLQSIRSSGDSVFLAWQKVTEADMKGYQIERKTNGSFTIVSAPDKATNTFTDTGLAPGLAVVYRISSVDTSGNVSAPSGELSTVLPKGSGAPNRFAIEGKYRKRDQGVILKWNAPAGKTYVFRRKGDSGRFQPLNQTINSNQFIDKPAEKGRYDYFVKTYLPDGGKADSQVITVVVK